MKNIAIIEDETLIRDCISNMISDKYEYNIIEYNTTKALLKAIEAGDKQFDYITLDLDLSNNNDFGTNLIEPLRKLNINTKIIIITGITETRLIGELDNMGIEGMVSKLSPKETIYNAIESLENGNQFRCDEINKLVKEYNYQRFYNPDIKSKLTQREIEVLELVYNDKTNREVGEQLGITHRTVEVHKKNIRTKFEVKTNLGMIKVGLKQGYLTSYPSPKE